MPLGWSEVEIQWAIPADAATGTYRISHFGHYRRWHIFRGFQVHPYSGVTRDFQVTAN